MGHDPCELSSGLNANLVLRTKQNEDSDLGALLCRYYYHHLRPGKTEAVHHPGPLFRRPELSFLDPTCVFYSTLTRPLAQSTAKQTVRSQWGSVNGADYTLLIPPLSSTFRSFSLVTRRPINRKLSGNSGIKSSFPVWIGCRFSIVNQNMCSTHIE